MTLFIREAREGMSSVTAERVSRPNDALLESIHSFEARGTFASPITRRVTRSPISATTHVPERRNVAVRQSVKQIAQIIESELQNFNEFSVETVNAALLSIKNILSISKNAELEPDNFRRGEVFVENSTIGRLSLLLLKIKDDQRFAQLSDSVSDIEEYISQHWPGVGVVGDMVNVSPAASLESALDFISAQKERTLGGRVFQTRAGTPESRNSARVNGIKSIIALLEVSAPKVNPNSLNQEDWKNIVLGAAYAFSEIIGDENIFKQSGATIIKQMTTALHNAQLTGFGLSQNVALSEIITDLQDKARQITHDRYRLPNVRSALHAPPGLEKSTPEQRENQGALFRAREMVDHGTLVTQEVVPQLIEEIEDRFGRFTFGSTRRLLQEFFEVQLQANEPI